MYCAFCFYGNKNRKIAMTSKLHLSWDPNNRTNKMALYRSLGEDTEMIGTVLKLRSEFSLFCLNEAQ
uniref:Uncharacterized protein n=1 Tax=Rhizophora mucronata TaxID=61149 RepID=A0A2P2QM01_RHIMU